MVDEINQSRLELFDKLVEVGCGDYIESCAYVNIVSGTASYSLPTDYYKTIALDIKTTQGTWASIPHYSMGDRNLYSDLDSYSREDISYRIRGDYVTFAPTPNWTATNEVRHYYVSIPTDINASNSLTNQYIDGVAGWDDYVVYDCLVKFLGGKEEGDASQWERQLARLDARIEKMRVRDRGAPDSIIVED